MTIFSEMHGPRIGQQRGSTLIVALIMLALLTMIAVSAMKSTTSSIQVVGNAQLREEAKAAAQKAIEKVMSTGDFRTTLPPAEPVDINGDGVNDYTVTFAAPTCLSKLPTVAGEPGVPPVCAGSIGGLPACSWTVWDITATVSDASGASVVVHQGVRTIAGVGTVSNKCS